MKHAQASQITEESRLLYLVIKMLKNRPTPSMAVSPGKIITSIKSLYKRIVDRVSDDPILSKLSLPLPNINSKSIGVFISKEEKKANLKATLLPKVKRHQKVTSDRVMMQAPSLPNQIPSPDRPQHQYPILPHVTGKRRAEKRRLDLEEPEPVSSGPKEIAPRPSSSNKSIPKAAPIIVVVPSQPKAPSISVLPSTSHGTAPFVPIRPRPAPPPKPALPNKSLKPCLACGVPQCGGSRQRYTPSKDKTVGSSQKIFTFCLKSGKSATSGFDDTYLSYMIILSVLWMRSWLGAVV